MDHALLLLDTVAVIEAVRNRDFDEAHFRCRQVDLPPLSRTS